MEALIDWVTQIIVFILLTIIIEMFIPTTKIAKYVRLVIGLIFLLIFLKPLFYIFQIDVAQIVSDEINEQTLLSGESEVNHLMEEQNKHLQAINDSYILAEMTEQLKQQSEATLTEHSVQIAHIEYVFTEDSQHINSLEQLIVYIESNSTDGSEENIVIDEVIIDVHEQKDMDDAEHLSEIKTALQDVWQLNEEEIIVKWGSTSS